ncbi:MAG: hypothetical protein M3N30_10650 [Bacteroidota bacterium]|nr:hypothetical protein [Bacteroidota bacterium]
MQFPAFIAGLEICMTLFYTIRMIPEEIILKLDLEVIPAPYGDSVNTGAQSAVFKKDSGIYFYDGNNCGIPYPEKYFRAEKQLEDRTIRLFVSYEHIINTDNDIVNRIITIVNSPNSLIPSIL